MSVSGVLLLHHKDCEEREKKRLRSDQNIRSATQKTILFGFGIHIASYVSKSAGTVSVFQPL